MALGESLARTDHVITVSETVRQEVLAHGLMSPEQVTAIHLAAGSDFRPHTSEMLDYVLNALGLKSGRYSLFVGTLEPRKNIQRLVEAYGMLPKEVRHNWPLVIAGAVAGTLMRFTCALQKHGPRVGCNTYPMLTKVGFRHCMLGRD